MAGLAIVCSVINRQLSQGEQLERPGAECSALLVLFLGVPETLCSIKFMLILRSWPGWTWNSWVSLLAQPHICASSQVGHRTLNSV